MVFWCVVERVVEVFLKGWILGELLMWDDKERGAKCSWVVRGLLIWNNIIPGRMTPNGVRKTMFLYVLKKTHPETKEEACVLLCCGKDTPRNQTKKHRLHYVSKKTLPKNQ